MRRMADTRNDTQTDQQTAGAMIESPCNKICTLDAAAAFCTGCGRTRSEIAQWSTITSSERRAIMAELPRRLKQT